MVNERNLNLRDTKTPMDVIIVCHTEFGFVHNQRIISQKKAKQGVKIGVRNLIKIAEKYGAKVTFAICPEVVEFFPRNTMHEVGLHIHPGWERAENDGFKWYVGDTYLRKHCKQSTNSTVLRDYSFIEQEGMIKTGRDYIDDKLGIEPRVFVAGRWSVNNDTIKGLINAGITHDCSASAHSNLSHFDWSKLPRICMPYNPTETDYQNKGLMPILIVPISQYFPSGNVNPEAAPMVGLAWLKACFSEYHRLGVPLFHICLHSPSMTDADFISVMDELLSFISNHKNINFKFASNIEKYDEVNSKTKILPYMLAINIRLMKTFIKTKRNKTTRRSGKRSKS